MRAVEQVRTDIRDLRMDLAKDYVRKEVQDERERLTDLQISGLESEVHTLNNRISTITTQRDTERDNRDKQIAAGNRWRWSQFITALGGPVATVLVLHWLHLIAAAPK